jgi:hypothetical protein
MRASDTAEIAFDNVESSREFNGRGRESFPYMHTFTGKVDYGYKRAC